MKAIFERLSEWLEIHSINCMPFSVHISSLHEANIESYITLINTRFRLATPSWVRLLVFLFHATQGVNYHWHQHPYIGALCIGILCILYIGVLCILYIGILCILYIGALTSASSVSTSSASSASASFASFTSASSASSTSESLHRHPLAGILLHRHPYIGVLCILYHIDSLSIDILCSS